MKTQITVKYFGHPPEIYRQEVPHSGYSWVRNLLKQIADDVSFERPEYPIIVTIEFPK